MLVPKELSRTGFKNTIALLRASKSHHTFNGFILRRLWSYNSRLFIKKQYFENIPYKSLQRQFTDFHVLIGLLSLLHFAYF